MIPDPPTPETPLVDGESDNPAGEPPVPRPGHHCAICGHPISPDLWDMTVFATPTTVAYLPCFFAAPSPRPGHRE